MNLNRLLYFHINTLFVRCYINLFKRNIVLGKNVRFNKFPIIHCTRKSSIYIGSNVKINSNNYHYHTNMSSRVKLMADREGAIIKIGDNSRIHGTCIHARRNIQIGKNCLIAANSQIFDCNGHDLAFNNVEERINSTGPAKEIIINDNVWIGINTIILPGVTIGRGSIIAAGSVVVKDIPPMCLAGGNPARVIKRYF